jgi:hypothetical protein
VAKLLETADVRLVPASTTEQQLRSQLVRALSDEDILTGAWRRFVAFNQAANERQRTFQRIYQGIVVLGVLATLVALLQTVLLAHHVIHRSQPSGRFFQVLVVILPISLTALIAANNKFRDGSKWIGFRQAAESVKQEIFRFRTRTGPYGPAQGAGTPANRLAERLGAISEGLMKSDVNEASYRQPSAVLPEGVLEDGDDGISHLSPDGYLRFRVQNQMTYYSQKARQHERETRLTWWAVLVIGSAGSVLAALGFGLWVALTTSIAAAIAAYVHVMRIENSLIQYNQAHAALSALRDWWSALGRVDRTSPARFDDLVDRAERIFESERAGWLKQMTDAMADLRAQQRTDHADEPSTRSTGPAGRLSP